MLRISGTKTLWSVYLLRLVFNCHFTSRLLFLSGCKSLRSNISSSSSSRSQNDETVWRLLGAGWEQVSSQVFCFSFLFFDRVALPGAVELNLHTVEWFKKLRDQTEKSVISAANTVFSDLARALSVLSAVLPQRAHKWTVIDANDEVIFTWVQISNINTAEKWN